MALHNIPFGEQRLQRSLIQTDSYYQEAELLWDRMDVAVLGSSASNILNSSELAQYLSPPSDLPQSELEAYIARSTYYDKTSDTLDGYLGLMFSEEPEITPEGDAITLELNELPYNGDTPDQYFRQIAYTFLKYGRVGLLGVLDADADGNLVPRIRTYNPRNITKFNRHRGQLEYVILYQPETFIDARGQASERQLYRCLWLSGDFNEETGQVPGQYMSAIYEDSKGWLNLISDVTPYTNSDGTPVTEIPFRIADTATGTGMGRYGRPPLLGLANMNLSHWLTLAQKANLEYILAFPTIFFKTRSQQVEDRTGNAMPGTTVQAFSIQALGTKPSVIETDDPDASLEYVQPNYQALAEFAAALKAKEELMDQLGARLLYSEQASNISFATQRLQRAERTSVISALAVELNEELSAVWQASLQRLGRENYEDYRIIIREDYDVGASPESIPEVKEAYDRGVVTKQTYIEAMVDGGALRPGFDVEAEVLATDAQAERNIDVPTNPAENPFNAQGAQENNE